MITEVEIHEYAKKIRAALTGLGFAYTTKKGDLVEVAYRKLKRAGDRYALLEVDTSRLPPRVSIPDIEAPKILTHLSAVVGRPVKKLNTVGLTYVIQLQAPPPAKPWPARAALPATSPEGLAYPWPFGITRDGEAVWADLLKTGHLLIGGKPGSGKSTAINAGLITLLRRHGPEDLRLLLVDPKAVELWPYAGIPHLAQPVATTADEAADRVTWLVGELARREAIFKDAGAKNLTAFNRAAAAPLPLLLAVFDEVTDLVLQWGGPKAPPFLELIRVSSKGRAFGIVLLLATQNPKADILDTALRENSGTRVSFKVDTSSQSRAILGGPGADGLPSGRPGRCLITGQAGDDLTQLQGFAVEDRDVADLVGRLKASTVSPLADREGALVAFARDRLGGTFKLEPLYDHFRGVWSWRQLAKLGKAWEARGWLTAQASATSPRLLTEALLKLAQGVGPDQVEAVRRSGGSGAINPDEDAVRRPTEGPGEAMPAGDV